MEEIQRNGAHTCKRKQIDTRAAEHRFDTFLYRRHSWVLEQGRVVQSVCVLCQMSAPHAPRVVILVHLDTCCAAASAHHPHAIHTCKCILHPCICDVCADGIVCEKKNKQVSQPGHVHPPPLVTSLCNSPKKKTGFATRPCSLLTLGKSRAAFLFRDTRACKLLGATLRKPGVYAYRTTRSCVWRACLKGVDLTTRTKT